MLSFPESVKYIESKTQLHPKIAIVLGSGLGGLVEKMQIEVTIPYSNIPNFPVSTVVGHRGELVMGKLNGVEVCIMNGRKHYYEGGGIQEVVAPLHVLSGLGINTLILSNAAGGLNPSFHVGDVMLIEDHINMMFAHPLFSNTDILSSLKKSMNNELYSKSLRKITLKIAEKEKIALQKGVYLAHSGPYFGTRSESAMQFNMGADAVGMSTIPEAIQAQALEVNVLAFSIITDIAAIGTTEHPTHDMVLKAANKASDRLSLLVEKLLPYIV